MNMQAAEVHSTIPFDAGKLDGLLEDAGIDVLVVTSKHNVQYLLGGYRFFFFENMDAIGLSRYLPIFIYLRGRAEQSIFIGNRLETFEKELKRFWTPVAETSWWTSADAMRSGADHIRKLGFSSPRIGVEAPFLPLDAADVLKSTFGGSLTDATVTLERLRARKSPAELEFLKQASEGVVHAMQATFASCRPGMTKHQVVQRLQSEEVSRDLAFDYCLIATGSSFNRAPSDQRLDKGDIISLDSGANYRGYIGDLCRMGVLGKPNAELMDLLAEVETIQQAARSPIRAGARGGDIFAAAQKAMHHSPHASKMDFLAHGMGLVSHEAPRLTGAGPVPYPGEDEDRSLESGMVVSIETAILHPERGFIKLEDTVAVTETGCQGFGDDGREWNVIGGSD